MKDDGLFICKRCGLLFDTFIPYMMHVGFANPDSDFGCLPEESLRDRGMVLVDGTWREAKSMQAN